jgi:hypothetical protein
MLPVFVHKLHMQSTQTKSNIAFLKIRASQIDLLEHKLHLIFFGLIAVTIKPTSNVVTTALSVTIGTVWQVPPGKI